jgi:hypothetical protein
VQVGDLRGAVRVEVGQQGMQVLGDEEPAGAGQGEVVPAGGGDLGDAPARVVGG